MKSKVITALVAMWMMANIVNATDVTKFKIDGVGLGDKYSAKKNLLPCKNRFDNKINAKIVESNNICQNKNGAFDINFDIHDKIYRVHKESYNIDISDFESIKTNATNILGLPSMTGYKEYGGERTNTLCWGSCKQYTDASNTEALCYGDSKKCLQLFVSQEANGEISSSLLLIDFDIDQQVTKYKDSLERKQKKFETNAVKSSQANAYISWKTGYKYNQSDSYAPFSYQTTEIICSNGTKGTVFDYYNRTGGDRFIINGNRAVNSFNEGADYICGNK